MSKKHQRDEFHMKAITPVGLLGIRKKGEDDERPAIMSEGGDSPGAEMVHARKRPGEPILDLRPAYATDKGPAQVASTEYRKSYDRIFGKPKAKKYPN